MPRADDTLDHGELRPRKGAAVLPSLVANDLRASLTSFLGTTFILGDDDVHAELERFVADPDNLFETLHLVVVR